MKHDVTAILVNYHSAHDICAAVESVLQDATSVNVQIVVVDNSESTAEVDRLRARLPAHINILVAPRNLGFGQACNWAVRVSPASFYWLVNPDVRVLPGCLDALLGAMDADLMIGAASPSQSLDHARQWLFSPCWMPGAIDTWARAKASVDAKAKSRYARAISAEASRLWSAVTPIKQRALSGAALLVRNECVNARDGLFDPRYFMYFEDSDLCRSIKNQGRSLVTVPTAHAVHQWQLSDHKGGLMDASAPLFFEKHHSLSPWLQKAQDLCATTTLADRSEPGRAWHAQTTFLLPQTFSQGWVLEISPNPLFQSSVGCVGRGRQLPWPQPVLDATQGTPVFGRVSTLFTTDASEVFALHR